MFECIQFPSSTTTTTTKNVTGFSDVILGVSNSNIDLNRTIFLIFNLLLTLNTFLIAKVNKFQISISYFDFIFFFCYLLLFFYWVVGKVPRFMPTYIRCIDRFVELLLSINVPIYLPVCLFEQTKQYCFVHIKLIVMIRIGTLTYHQVFSNVINDS